MPIRCLVWWIKITGRPEPRSNSPPASQYGIIIEPYDKMEKKEKKIPAVYF